MPRPQFSIRALLWLTLVVAIGCWSAKAAWKWIHSPKIWIAPDGTVYIEKESESTYCP